MNFIKKIYYNFLSFFNKNDRYFSILLLPLSLYNVITTLYKLNKHHNILIKTINDNVDFYRALNMLGFKPNGFFGLVSIHKVDPHLNDEEIYKIANQNFIMIVKKFIIDESLLDIVKIEIIKIKDFRIKFTINMVTYRLLIIDIYDFVWSCILWLTFILLYFKLWLN